jgi:hypothetical protein
MRKNSNLVQVSSPVSGPIYLKYYCVEKHRSRNRIQCKAIKAKSLGNDKKRGKGFTEGNGVKILLA